MPHETTTLTPLYRIENPLIPANPNGETSHEALVGQWFTSSLDTATHYLRKSTQTFGKEAGPIDGAQLAIAHVNTADLAKYHVSGNEIARTMDVEKDNYIIPRDGSVPIDILPIDDTIADLKGHLGRIDYLLEARRRITERLGQITAEKSLELSEPPEILIDHKILYHGSATSGIKELDVSEENTVGRGVYLVENPEDAAGYARRRAHVREGSPIIYEVAVENLKLVNLDNAQKLEQVMEGFAAILEKYKADSSEGPWFATALAHKTLTTIKSGVKVGRVRDAAGSYGAMFSDYLKGLGYDGLKALEGGEGEEIGRHETYLIFDPHKAEITSEQPVK